MAILDSKSGKVRREYSVEELVEQARLMWGHLRAFLQLSTPVRADVNGYHGHERSVTTPDGLM